jgi:hypothetical protein
MAALELKSRLGKEKQARGTAVKITRSEDLAGEAAARLSLQSVHLPGTRQARDCRIQPYRHRENRLGESSPEIGTLHDIKEEKEVLPLQAPAKP